MSAVYAKVDVPDERFLRKPSISPDSHDPAG
jgi:hypothetical protein